MSPRFLLAVIAGLAGCDYPSFAFADAAAPDETARALEDTSADTSVDTFLEPEDTADSSSSSDTMADTTVIDAAPSLPRSCAELHTKDPALPSAAYLLDPDGAGPVTPFQAYCDMEGDGGGWTLALKLDGAKKTFAFGASYWTDDKLLAAESTDLSKTEAKHASFVTMPFTKLRVGMLEGTTRRDLVLDVARSSLRAAFSSGLIATTAGRAAWLGLVESPQLQPDCNREGLNLDHTADLIGGRPRVRIGIVGNQEPHCDSPDSFLGLGAELTLLSGTCYNDVDPGIVAGNVAPSGCGTVERRTATFGYVFLR